MQFLRGVSPRLLASLTFWVASMRVDLISCRQRNFKRLAWYFCIVLVNRRLSQKRGDGSTVKGDFVHHNFNKNDSVCE